MVDTGLPVAGRSGCGRYLAMFKRFSRSTDAAPADRDVRAVDPKFNTLIDRLAHLEALLHTVVDPEPDPVSYPHIVAHYHPNPNPSAQLDGYLVTYDTSTTDA